jgi:small-conductance mechanosensitive channel
MTRSFIAICLILLIGLLAAMSAGCQRSPMRRTTTPSPTSTATPTITPIPTTAPSEGSGVQPTEEQVLSTPTLAPTATPSPLDVVVEDVTQSIGLDDLSIFGLNVDDFVNLIVSILIILVGSLLGALLVDLLLWLLTLTPPEFDNQLVATIEKQLKWLIVLFLIQFATARLAFLSPELKQWLDLIYFSLFVLLIAAIVWKLVDYMLEGPLLKASSPENRSLIITFTPLLNRSIQVLIFLVSLAIILQAFGVNLSALLAVLGLGGLAISLAAKESLEDIINGFIILIDRPFQIGDRIKIESMDTWGDIESIGARTTQIRTIDNRRVIVPNSIIGNSQVENYTGPDPSLRMEVSLGIAYGSDIDQVLEIMSNAILSVPGVMENQPPVVEFREFGDSAMIFRALYWLNNYRDIRLRTQVNRSIYMALTEANIEMPFVTYDVNLAYKDHPRDNDKES